MATTHEDLEKGYESTVIGSKKPSAMVISGRALNAMSNTHDYDDNEAYLVATSIDGTTNVYLVED